MPCNGAVIFQRCIHHGSSRAGSQAQGAAAARHLVPLAVFSSTQHGRLLASDAATASSRARHAGAPPPPALKWGCRARNHSTRSMAQAPTGAAGSAAAEAAAVPAAESLPLVLVVAAVLLDSTGRVLLAQRPPGKALAGLWEFPGGKVDPGEAPEAALVRELQEELGISVAPAALRPLTFASHAYERFHLLMPTYECQEWRGELAGQEGQAVAWATAGELQAGAYAMPPADLPMLPAVLAAMRAAHAAAAAAAT